MEWKSTTGKISSRLFILNKSYPDTLSTPKCRAWAQALRSSYNTLIAEPLSTALEEAPEHRLAEALFDAPFALLAHGTEPDPIFCFANRVSLNVFGYDWQTITRLPSRFSAEPENRSVRSDLLEKVTRQGYITNYSGIRIAADGRRFQIQQATVWNVFDASGSKIGQAACFEHWIDLNQE